MATIQCSDLRRLLDAILGEDTPTWARFRDAPAAKHYHQAYRHGLLEHSLTVAQAVSAISATFPGIDRDVAVAGALVHDIGKLETYALDRRGDRDERRGPSVRRDPARLLPDPQPRSRRSTASPPTSRRRCCTSSSAITARSSTAARSSPRRVRPRSCTGIDNLGARLGSFDRVEKALPDGQQWSGYDKALGGGAYFAGAALSRAA